METAWRSVGIIKNKQGRPHVLQQKIETHTDSGGVKGDGEEYTKPTSNHRMVPLGNLTK